jgi:hypothetical protein
MAGSGGTAGAGGTTSVSEADASTDSGPVISSTCTGANDSACQIGGANGLCLGGTCSACTPVNDDLNCTSAYGSATAPYQCIAGACTPGDCRVDTDCKGTDADEICGVTTPNTCGKCTTDAQCQAASYGAKYICDTAKGTCVSGACTTTSKACTSNAKDFCCGSPAACVPGNCCVTADCTGNSQTCVNFVCSTCKAPTDNTYYVDPLNGSDKTGVGSGGTAGGACAFQSITRALAVIGAAANAGTTIKVLPTGTVGAAETFPLTPGKNITIEGATTGTPTVVDVPASTVGFTLAEAKVALSNLTITGTSLAANAGISVTAGTASLATVIVEDMGTYGIGVSGGTLAIGTAVQSNHNKGDGLKVTAGKVTISVPTGDTAASFNNNSYGIVILDTGSITIGAATGQAAEVAHASVNTHAGLFIEQTPGTGTLAPPANVVYNFKANTNGTNGVHLYGGSSLELRNSSTQGNADNGLWVEAYSASAGDAGKVTSSDLSQINLGTTTPADPGGNTFQYAEAASPNAGAGICVDLAAAADQQLNAAGNIFEGTNCATATVTLRTNNTCTGAVDYAIVNAGPVGDAGADAGTTNSIIVSTCH